MNLKQLSDATEAKIGSISRVEIKEALTSMDIYENLQRAVQERNNELIGSLVLMGIYQHEQKKVTEETKNA